MYLLIRRKIERRDNRKNENAKTFHCCPVVPGEQLSPGQSCPAAQLCRRIVVPVHSCPGSPGPICPAAE